MIYSQINVIKSFNTKDDSDITNIINKYTGKGGKQPLVKRMNIQLSKKKKSNSKGKIKKSTTFPGLSLSQKMNNANSPHKTNNNMNLSKKKNNVTSSNKIKKIYLNLKSNSTKNKTNTKNKSSRKIDQSNKKRNKPNKPNKINHIQTKKPSSSTFNKKSINIRKNSSNSKNINTISPQQNSELDISKSKNKERLHKARIRTNLPSKSNRKKYSKNINKIEEYKPKSKTELYKDSIKKSPSIIIPNKRNKNQNKNDIEYNNISYISNNHVKPSKEINNIFQLSDPKPLPSVHSKSVINKLYSELKDEEELYNKDSLLVENNTQLSIDKPKLIKEHINLKQSDKKNNFINRMENISSQKKIKYTYPYKKRENNFKTLHIMPILLVDQPTIPKKNQDLSIDNISDILDGNTYIVNINIIIPKQLLIINNDILLDNTVDIKKNLII